MTLNGTAVIQQAAEKKNEKKEPSPVQLMNHIINAEGTQSIIRNSLKENAGAFTASVIDLYNSDKTLQQCDPRQVMGECLKAVSLKLPINKQLGMAYIIPYRNKTGVKIPQFQLGYKGYIQLCLRTGAYKYINAGPVFEGELVKHDKLTGEVDLSGEQTGDKIIGYFAFMETVNGFRKCFYWTVEKVIAHAKKHSKTYGSDTSTWATDFDSMATKTVLRNLLSHYGIMSIEMETALTNDNADLADEVIIQDDDLVIEATYTEQSETVGEQISIDASK